MKQDRGAISEMKKSTQDQCVFSLLGRLVYPHMAAERTCWIKGDNVVLHEHNSCTGKSMVISNLATFLEHCWLRRCRNGV